MKEAQPQAALNRLDMAIHNAGILRTESVHIQASDARAIAAFCARFLARESVSGMEAYWLAGHRTDQPHDCFVMNCNGLLGELDALRAALSSPETTPAGVLDEAWEAAEKALPPDFHLELTGPLPGSGRWLAKSVPPFLPYEEWKLALREEFGPTPAAALHALAAALGRSGSGGGRG